MTKIELIRGDCLEKMRNIPDVSVDMVLTDPPFGTISCKWDVVIPFESMWHEINRVIKPNGAILLFGNQPFTSALIMSNPKMFKYTWVWIKNRPTGSLHARNRPMGKCEDIIVFSQAPMGHQSLLGDRRMRYIPQGVVSTNKKKTVKPFFHGNHIGERTNQLGREYEVFTNFPNNILNFDKDEDHLHPTQKPVKLCEYLIKTYTNESETILDFTMGSFTTAIACLNTKRSFIGIEKDDKYFQVGTDRLEKHLLTLDDAPEIVYN